MTPDDVVVRARSVVGKGILYGLGHGGLHADDPLPTRDGLCDCSGFVAWALGVSRHTDNPWYKAQNGGWLETTAIVKDALCQYGFFDAVLWVDAKPGMLLVYPDRKDADGTRHQGHVGIVTASSPGVGPTAVIHCSLGASNVYRDAIRETSPDAWKGRGVVARCAWVHEPEGASA